MTRRRLQWEEANKRDRIKGMPPFPWTPNSLSYAQQKRIKQHQESIRDPKARNAWAARRKSSERMRARWRNKRKEMERYLAMANAKASERNRTRWKFDRARMVEIARRNARKGTAALTGTHYSPARSRRASERQRGKIQGGRGAKSPDNFNAKYYSFIAPDGSVHQGQNILHFVRQHLDMFDAGDIKWIKGTCLAGKALARLRPWMKRPRERWKDWRWYSDNQTGKP